MNSGCAHELGSVGPRALSLRICLLSAWIAVVVASLAAAVAPSVLSPVLSPMLPPVGALMLGDRFEGWIDGPGEVDRVRFAGLAHEVVSLALVAAHGAGLKPRIELRRVDQPGPLLAAAGSGKSAARVTGFSLPSTGLYELSISGSGGTQGGYKLATRGRLPASVARLGPPQQWPGPGTLELSFEARPGYALSGRLRARGELLVSGVVLQTPAGPMGLASSLRRKGRALHLRPVSLAQVGAFTLSVTSAGAAGDVLARLRLRRLPRKRSSLREARFSALVPGPQSVLLDETEGIVLEQVEQNSLQLLLLPQAPALAPGSILASRAQSFLRRVLSLSPLGEQSWLLQTEPVGAEQAFDGLRLDFGLGGVHALMSPAPDDAPTAGQPPSPAQLIDLTGLVLVDDGLVQVRVQQGWLALDPSVAGRLELTAGAPAGTPQIALELAQRLALSAHLELIAEASQSSSWKGSVELLPLSARAVLPAPFGLALALRSQVLADLELSFDEAGQLALAIDLRQAFSGHLDESGPVGTFQSGKPAHAVALGPVQTEDGLQASLVFGLRSRLELELVELTTPVIEVGSDVTLQAEGLRPEPGAPTVSRGTVDLSLELRLGLQPGAGSSLDGGRAGSDGSDAGGAGSGQGWFEQVTSEPEAASDRAAFGALVGGVASTCPAGVFGQVALQRQVQGVGWLDVAGAELTGLQGFAFATPTPGRYRVRAEGIGGTLPEPSLSPVLVVRLPEEGGPAALHELLLSELLDCACSTCTLPNLVLESVGGSPDVLAVFEPGTPLHVSVALRNASTVALSESFRVDVYLSSSPDVLVVEHLLASLSLGPLPAGGVTSLELDLPAPPAMVCGPLTLWAALDVGGDVAESDEGDNLDHAPQPLELTGCNPMGSVAFVQPSSSLSEAGDSGQVDLLMSLVGGALHSDLSVDVVVVGGTASDGQDVVPFGVRTVVFPEGSMDGARAALTVTTLDDPMDEPDETLELGLCCVLGPGLIDTRAALHVVSIVDDDPPAPDALLSFGATELLTPDESASSHELPVLLTLSGGALQVPVSVELIDLPGLGSATPDVDYSFGGGSVIFPAGSVDGATGSLAFQVLPDARPEQPDETIVFGLGQVTGPADLGLPDQLVATIQDDDPLAMGGSFSPGSGWVTGGKRPMGFDLGDWNADGFPDLVVANFGNGGLSESVTVIYNQAGSFQAPTIVQIANSMTRPFDVMTGDYNGDGQDDIVALGLNDPDMRVFLGSGTGFPNQFKINDAQAKWHGLAGDLDQDGDLDYVVADGISGGKLYLNDGSGTVFHALPLVGGGTKSTDVASGSLDSLHDDAPDLVFADTTSDTISILLNAGAGVFNLAAVVAVSAKPSAVAVGDLNDDGRLDYVVANTSSNALDLALGDGLGGVSSISGIAVGASQDDVLVQDINGDSFLDICVVLKGSPGSVKVFWGDGSGFFPLEASMPVQDAPKAVRVGDVDGDGKLDLIVINSSSDSFSVALQD